MEPCHRGRRAIIGRSQSASLSRVPGLHLFANPLGKHLAVNLAGCGVTNARHSVTFSPEIERPGMNVALMLLVAVQVLVGQDTANWRDPSPHQVQFVVVDSSIRLEVLDWGGTGRPIVFVGCYLTAHVYDEIAPKLTDQFHVYAVTRRGVGVSDRPMIGYDPQRRAADILEVIGALGVQKPILVGNSCGGGILHSLGAEHPERIGGLVYLDAAEDPTLRLSDYGFVAVDQANLPKRAGEPQRVVFPEAERKQLAEHPIDPAIRKAIVEDNNVK